MPLSLCLIAKNEEKNLEGLFESFYGFYDEIILVDTGSTDDTKKIAEKFKAKIFDFKWIDDFSAARNFAISKASQEFVLMVDADDRIKRESLDYLKSALKKFSEMDVFFIPYEVPISGTEKWKKSHFPKIWRRTLNLKYKLRVHEFLDVRQEHMNRAIQLKYGFFTTGDFSLNSKRNLDILYAAVKDEPNESRYLYFLGNDNQQQGNYEEAIKWYEEFEKLNDINPDELNRIFVKHAVCLKILGKLTESKYVFDQAILAQPKFIEPYLHLGEIAMEEKNFLDALMFFNDAQNLKLPSSHMYVNEALYNGYATKRYQEALIKYKNSNG